jgi:hypothetical protein
MAGHKVLGSNWSHDDILQQWMPILQPEYGKNKDTFDAESLRPEQILIDQAGTILLSL